ncbi:MAG: 3-isopropylmalate dehydrogenase [Lachnospiraceae bacterium]|nr:3-isopropylmalate dehydrogenase [Lachnospiraceae bacterium]
MMAKEEKVQTKLQWHPAFFAGIQIELEEERDKLIFENEHQLSTKPLEIDVLIIKKQPNVQIKKNIGRIFRGYNIIEYKSPEDSLSIDDFYKVYGYACFYKSDVLSVNAIKAEDITLTFVVNKFPREMVKELQRTRKIEVVKFDEGIYHISGDIFPIQVIHTTKLSKENNFWLRNLTNDLKAKEDARNLLEKYNDRQQENLYQSVMDIIVKANIELFEEVDDMCDALMEIVKPKVDAKVKEAEEKGRELEKMDLIRKMVAKEMPVEEIADLLEESVETVQNLIKSL